MSKKQDKKLMLIPKEIDITEVKKDLRNVFRNHPKLIEKIRNSQSDAEARRHIQLNLKTCH